MTEEKWRQQPTARRHNDAEGVPLNTFDTDFCAVTFALVTWRFFSSSLLLSSQELSDAQKSMSLEHEPSSEPLHAKADGKPKSAISLLRSTLPEIRIRICSTRKNPLSYERWRSAGPDGDANVGGDGHDGRGGTIRNPKPDTLHPTGLPRS